MIVNFDVAGQSRVVRKYGIVTNVAVVRDVTISHNPIVVPERRFSATVRGPSVYAAVFADDVVLANLECRVSRIIEFFILWIFAYRTKVINFCATSDPSWTLDDDMRADPTSLSDFDVWANDAPRTKLNISGDFRIIIDNCRRIDQRVLSDSVVMNCALETSSSST
jgi:hypothetical protein